MEFVAVIINLYVFLVSPNGLNNFKEISVVKFFPERLVILKSAVAHLPFSFMLIPRLSAASNYFIVIVVGPVGLHKI
jgi:hypothetical protein